MKEVRTKYWVGDRVSAGGINAIITGILFNGEGVEYRCSYFYEGGYNSVWLQPYEVDALEDNPGLIGYSHG